MLFDGNSCEIAASGLARHPFTLIVYMCHQNPIYKPSYFAEKKLKMLNLNYSVGIWCDIANERRTRESKKGPKFVLKGARFPLGEE